MLQLFLSLSLIYIGFIGTVLGYFHIVVGESEAMLSSIEKVIPFSKPSSIEDTIVPFIEKKVVEVPYVSEIHTDCRQKKCIALTFDDGPSKYTPRLLKYLQNAGVHATFFVLGGKAQEYPRILKQIYSENHQIANHSWSHRDFTKISSEEMKKEVASTSQKIKESVGIQHLILRPPYGAIDTEILAMIQHPVILWSIDSYDWKRPKVDSIIANATTGVRTGSIILMHDTYERSVSAVPTIIETLQSQGFTFVTIDDLFGTGGLENGKKYNRVK